MKRLKMIFGRKTEEYGTNECAALKKKKPACQMYKKIKLNK